MTTRPVLRSTAMTDHVANALDGRARRTTKQAITRRIADSRWIRLRCALHGLQILVYGKHRGRSFTDRRRHAPARTGAHVADGEHARHGRLEQVRIAIERPRVVRPAKIGPGDDEPLVV